MKIKSSELEIKNKKFVIKYGLILLVVSLLLLIVGLIAGVNNLNIDPIFKGMIFLPFPVFFLSWFLMIICYNLEIVSKYDFTRTFFNKNLDDAGVFTGEVIKTWFLGQSLLGFFAFTVWLEFQMYESTYQLYECLLFLISPTILFIISSYFARLNRIENKIDLLLSQKEENQND